MRSEHRKNAADRLLVLILILAVAANLTGCINRSDMPFNGDIRFHDLTLTIPKDYIRDSTESTEDLWVFEKGFYSQYIIITRNDIQGDATESLNSYAEYLTEQGVQVRRETFLETEALISSWTNGDLFCQELMFACNGSLYAVSLRGGTEEEFQSLIRTIGIAEAPVSEV